MIVDSGAYFLLLSSIHPSLLSPQYLSVLGFTGQEQKLPLTRPLHPTLGNQTFNHQFLYSPDCPVNLLGRDILTAVRATVFFSPQEVDLHAETGPLPILTTNWFWKRPQCHHVPPWMTSTGLPWPQTPFQPHPCVHCQCCGSPGAGSQM